MPSNRKRPGILVPARFIPTPSTISPEARACLSNLPPIAAASEPDTEDTAAWRAHIDARNGEVTSLMSANAGTHPGEVIAHDLSRSRLYEVKPASFSPRHEKHAILYIHGGAFIYGGGYAAALSAMSIASLSDAARALPAYKHRGLWAVRRRGTCGGLPFEGTGHRFTDARGLRAPFTAGRLDRIGRHFRDER
jgi:hypothetical protein